MELKAVLPYLEKYNLSTDKASQLEREEMWKEVASSDDAKKAHADALGQTITNQINCVNAIARNNDGEALREIATAVLTTEIVLDILKENIASLVMNVRQLGPMDQAWYKVKRLNNVTVINNTPTLGQNYVAQVGRQNDQVPILTNDNRVSYSYSTRNALIGMTSERDEAIEEIRRGILESRERQFINLIRTFTTVPGGAGTANVPALPDYAMANESVPDINNVVFDSLSNGMTKRNLNELLYKLEQYNYNASVLYCSARRKADIRSWIATQATTMSSPVDFFTQREVLQNGKLEGLYGLTVKTLNYLKDNEVYMWDNSRDFGEIFLKGDIQVEDVPGKEGPFSRDLNAAQNEGQALYNARRIAKLELTP